MKAPMQTAKRAMVAAMVMTMTATSMASAAPHAAGTPSAPRDPRVNARVVAVYNEGSWLKPSAVVLDSKRAWDEWNANEVNAGRAIAVEKAPDVDWGRDAVMIVALGENMNGSASVKLSTCTREGTDTEVSLECSLLAGGTAPSLVLALPRGSAHSVKLRTNVALADMPERASYVTASSTSGDPMPVAVVSWGALKADYR
jgi:hypothetical protein